MDCQMPEMDGYQATQRLRDDPSMLRNDVVVIALTAQAMREDEQKCLDAGMDDYLSKPVDPQLLNQKLSQWLPPKCLRQFAS
jgi:CheY-like chemotaxis protein